MPARIYKQCEQPDQPGYMRDRDRDHSDVFFGDPEYFPVYGYGVHGVVVGHDHTFAAGCGAGCKHDDRRIRRSRTEGRHVRTGFPGGEPAAGNRIAEFQNETAARCGTVFKPAGEYFIPYQSAQRRLLDQGKDFCFPVLGREGHGCGVQSADRVE